MNAPNRRRMQVGIFLTVLMLSSGCIGAAKDVVEPIEEPNPVTATINLEGDPMTKTDYVIAVMTVNEGEAPYIVSWTLNGELVQSSSSLRYEAGFMTVGTHQLDARIIDSNAGEGEAAIIFTIADANRAPLVDLELPSEGIAGVPIAWSVDATDPDGDNLVVEVVFSDGVTLRDTSGQHIWSNPGTYSVRVSVTDPSGFIATAQESIRIDDAEAPLLTVSTNPSPQGRIHLNLAGEISISTVVEDPLGPASISIDWGDGSTSAPAQSEESHQYSEEGIYVVRVTATGSTGITAERMFHVEVVVVVDDLEVV